MSISPLYYPEVSTYITWVFTIFISLAVVYSPTVLRFKLLAAIMIFFIPMGLENFGLPYYSFFWAGILLFLVVLWEPGKKLYLRIFYILLGGLSSPIIFMLTPLQLFRVVVIKEHRRDEIISFIFILITFLLQYRIFLSDGFSGNPINIDLHFLLEYIRKFYGLYYLNHIASNSISLQTIGGIVVLLLFFIYWIQNIKDKYFYIIMALLLGTGFSSVFRKYIEIDPIMNGARYFFYPYIMLAWSLLYISGGKRQWYRYITIPILILSVIVSFYYPTRTHDKLNYKKYLIACSNPKNNIDSLPEHFSGDNTKFFFQLGSDICKELLNKGIFDIPENLKVFTQDLHKLKELPIPKDIDFNLTLNLLDNGNTNIYKFSQNRANKKIENILLYPENLEKIKFQLKGKIKNSQEIASLFVKIGDNIIFTDEDINQRGHTIIFDEKIVFTDPMHDIASALLGKSFNFQLYAISKDGHGYYPLVNIPIIVPSIPKIVDTTKKSFIGFKFGIDKINILNDKLQLKGWFTELDNSLKSDTIKTTVFIKLDNQFYLTTREYRKDVYLALKNTKYRYAGFSLSIPLAKLSSGEHTVNIFGLSQDKTKIFTLPKPFKIIIDNNKKRVKYIKE